MPQELAHRYRQAIGQLITMDGASFSNVFPQALVIVSAVWHARDEDYDVIRKIDAQMNGAGALRMGSTKEIEPYTLADKRRNLRQYQRALYDAHGLFLELAEVYDEGLGEEMLEDLLLDRIDLAEMPPLQAGEALERGLDYLGTLSWPELDDDTNYESMVIRKRGSSFALTYPDGVYDKMIAAIGPPAQIVSASGYAYLFYELEKDGMRIDADNIEWFSNEFEVINAVANGGGRTVGVVSDFRLRRMRQENDMAEGVEVVEPSRVQIPAGAYMLSRARTDSYREEPALKDELLRIMLSEATRGQAEQMRPGFRPLALQSADRIEAVYRYAYPKDLSSQWALIVAGAFTVVAGVIFMMFYRE